MPVGSGLEELPPLACPPAQVYEMLASLEGTSMKAQQALESGTNVNLQEATHLNSYFQKASWRWEASLGQCLAWPGLVPHFVLTMNVVRKLIHSPICAGPCDCRQV